MSPLYELVVMGGPSDEQVRELEQLVSQAIKKFGLSLGKEISWLVCPQAFHPEQKRASAAVFFGRKGAPQGYIPSLIQNSIPVLPVVLDPAKVHEELPPLLQGFNCLAYNEVGMSYIRK